MHRKPESQLLTKYLSARIPVEDYQRLQKLAEFYKVSPGRMIRHIIIERCLGQSDPLPDQLKAFREAVYQFSAAGRNLNQLVRAANSGQQVDPGEVRLLCQDIQDGLMKANAELKTYMSRRRKLEVLEPRQAA